MDGKLDKKILEVPHLSQILDVSDEKWHKNSCGIVVLAMALKYFLREESPSSDRLIKEGVDLGGHNENYGWVHNTLVLLAHNYGLYAYSEEFKSRNNDFQERLSQGAIKKFKDSILNEKPVIVSVESGFRKNKSSHLIVLVGLEVEENEIKGFYFHDPHSEERGDGEAEFVPIERFLEYWRKLAIFVSKNA